jgi:hypothetical protein
MSSSRVAYNAQRVKIGLEAPESAYETSYSMGLALVWNEPGNVSGVIEALNST